MVGLMLNKHLLDGKEKPTKTEPQDVKGYDTGWQRKINRTDNIEKRSRHLSTVSIQDLLLLEKYRNL